MEDKNKPNKKGPIKGSGSNKNVKKPFNFYWIYAIIGVVVISLNLLNFSGGQSEISPSKFEQFVKDGDVEKVVIINEKKGEVYLTSEALEKEEHSKKTKAPLIKKGVLLDAP